MTLLIDEPALAEPAPAQPAESPVSQAPPKRLPAIDIARGIALLGMMTVHVLISGKGGDHRVLAWLLDAPGGRASVLFFTLSGLSLSVIAKQRRRSAQPSALRRRGAVLVMLGLVMANTFWGSTILHYYGIMFLVAPWLVGARRRSLLGIAGVAFVGGAVANMFSPDIFNQLNTLSGDTGWFATTAAGMLFGLYALAVWIGFFCVGIVFGRLDLDCRATAMRMAAIGAVATVGVTVISDALPGTGRIYESTLASPSDSGDGSSSVDPAGDPNSSVAADPKTGEVEPTEMYNDSVVTLKGLNDLSAHSNRTAWALQSLSIATTVIGLLLLAGRRLERLLWPLAALGSMSMSAYVIHTFLVQDVWQWLGGEDSSHTVTRNVITLVCLEAALVLIAVVIRRRWRQGPMEWFLKWLSGAPRPAS